MNTYSHRCVAILRARRRLGEDHRAGRLAAFHSLELLDRSVHGHFLAEAVVHLATPLSRPLLLLLLLMLIVLLLSMLLAMSNVGRGLGVGRRRRRYARRRIERHPFVVRAVAAAVDHHLFHDLQFRQGKVEYQTCV